MWLKAMIATFLAVLLLSASCARSVCQISCDTKAQGGSCHHGRSAISHSAPSSARQMPRMKQCGMKGSNASNSVSAEATASCRHDVCGDTPVLPKSETGFATHLIQDQYVVTVVTSFLPAVFWAHDISETPPLRDPSPVSLHTTLRI
jgi:hypothetical protein